MTARALLPCPFCGGDPRSADLAGWEVICECGCMFALPGHEATSERLTIAAWNRRASSLEGQADGEGIPEGYDVAGNFGNGKWYFTKDDHPQAYLGKGWDTRQGAIAAAIDAARTAQSKDKPA